MNSVSTVTKGEPEAEIGERGAVGDERMNVHQPAIAAPARLDKEGT
jgi:hypothetical protein